MGAARGHLAAVTRLLEHGADTPLSCGDWALCPLVCSIIANHEQPLRNTHSSGSVRVDCSLCLRSRRLVVQRADHERTSPVVSARPCKVPIRRRWTRIASRRSCARRPQASTWPWSRCLHRRSMSSPVTRCMAGQRCWTMGKQPNTCSHCPQADADVVMFTRISVLHELARTWADNEDMPAIPGVQPAGKFLGMSRSV